MNNNWFSKPEELYYKYQKHKDPRSNPIFISLNSMAQQLETLKNIKKGL
jgi:hypothetical protein